METGGTASPAYSLKGGIRKSIKVCDALVHRQNVLTIGIVQAYLLASMYSEIRVGVLVNQNCGKGLQPDTASTLSGGDINWPSSRCVILRCEPRL